MTRDINAQALMEASKFDGKIFRSADDFDAAFDYVLDLLEKANLLYCIPSFHLSAFISITAIEEIAKAHVGVSRRGATLERFKKKDPLLQHNTKHKIAVLPTVFMGGRIQENLGKSNCDRLQEEVNKGVLGKTRMACLYFDLSSEGLITPFQAISPSRAWELLILSLETLDDALVGYTGHTLANCHRIDKMFDTLIELKPDEYT